MASVHEPKPRFHVAPPQGWINDPNGPLFYKGYYHIFYQYVETGCTWSWGLMWGHAVSRDLINWQHLPPALAPTFGGFDGDGCFSGCATLDQDGTPIILYTGVRLRSSDTCGPLPPPECDLGNACIETQCIAFGNPADPKLTYWTKEEVPFLSLPPPNLNLTAWRDPYIIGRPGQDGQDCWAVMVGAGVKEEGGTALVYKSPTLRGGSWSYVGELCRGRGDTGIIWECPAMLNLPRLPPPPSPQVLLPAVVTSLARPQQVQSPLTAPPPGSLPLPVRTSPAAAVSTAAAYRDQQKPLPLPLKLDLSSLPAPASPRPPIKPRPASAADAYEVSADSRVIDGGGGVSPPLPALVSPRRLTVQVLPQAPISPLRSPARWNLPALTVLPHAPSPPAPRPPTAHTPGATPRPVIVVPGPTSPNSTAVLPTAFTNTSPATAAAALGFGGFSPDRQHRTPPAPPRVLQLLPGSTGRGTLPTTLAHGSPASPHMAAGAAVPPPRSPVNAISALLAGPSRVVAAATPLSPCARAATGAGPAAVVAPSPPRVKPLPLPLPLPKLASTDAAAPAADSWQCYQTLFCLCPDDCNSMPVYYLGSYDAAGSSYNLSDALGPFPLDLGDIFYAPNSLVDPEGRAVLWGWLQEKPRKVGSYDYAGCLSMPRMLFLEVNEHASAGCGGTGNSSGPQHPQRSYVHLVQRPPPDIAKLRVPGNEWLAEGLLLEPGSTLPVPLASGDHIELELSLMPLPQPLEPLSEGGGLDCTDGSEAGAFNSPGGAAVAGGQSPSARAGNPSMTAAALPAVVVLSGCQGGGGGGSRCSGVLLHNWRSGAEGAAALLYHWDSGVLETVFEALDPATLTFSLAAPGARRVGGRLQRPPAPGRPLALRVFLDYSCLEVFTGDGEVLTTRVYRGSATTASHHHHNRHNYHNHSRQQHQHQHLQNLASPLASPRASAVSTPTTPLPPPLLYGAGCAAASGVELVSFGCSTEFLSVAAYEVGSIWVDDV